MRLLDRLEQFILDFIRPRPAFPGWAVAQVLREIARGEDCWVDAGELDLTLTRNGWVIVLFIDAGEVDGVTVAIDPLGRQREHDSFWAELNCTPDDLLTDEEIRILSTMWEDAQTKSRPSDQCRYWTQMSGIRRIEGPMRNQTNCKRPANAS